MKKKTNQGLVKKIANYRNIRSLESHKNYVVGGDAITKGMSIINVYHTTSTRFE